MAVIIGSVIAGLAIDNITGFLFDTAKELVGRSQKFNSLVRDFAYGVYYLESQIDQLDDQNRELKMSIEKARELLNKCHRIVSTSRWNAITRCRYTTKLLRLDKALKIHVKILELRNQMEILDLSRKYGDRFVESANVENEILQLERYIAAMTEQLGRTNMRRVDYNKDVIPLSNLNDLVRTQVQIASYRAGMGAPSKTNLLKDVPSINPSFHGELDVPLRELKRKLCTDGLSMLVVTGNADAGKPYWQSSSVKTPKSKNNISAVMWLEHFLKEAGQTPLLLVLDDVWPGSESLLQKLDGLNKMPNYKLLVTSRFEFPEFGSPYCLNLSNDKESMDLLFAAPTSANFLVLRRETREATTNDESRAEFRAEMQAVKEDLANKLDCINKLLVNLISKNEMNPERRKEMKIQDINGHNVTQEMMQFHAWISDPNDSVRYLEIFEASKKWLIDLMTPGVWLSDTHVDTFLYFFRKDTHHHSKSLISQSCTILDTVFWSWMSWRWSSFQNDPNSYAWDSDIMDYPLGKSPQFTRPWSEVDYLYIPVNVTNQHWVAVRVDLIRRKFTVYDSMQSATKDEFICDLLNPVATMFPSLLIRSGFYEMRPELSPLNTPFQVIRLAENIPQQSESGDCGVFMLKFVEYLSSGQQLSFKEDDIPAFRERMAFLMFAVSHDTGDNINTLVS